MATKKALDVENIPDHWPRDRKIEALMPLAEGAVKHYRIRRDTTTIDRDDLYAEAYKAIIDAVEKFKPELNVNLIAFTKRKISWALLEAVRVNSHAPRSMISKGKAITWMVFSHKPSHKSKSLGEVLEHTLIDTQPMDANELILMKEERDRFYQYASKLNEKQQAVLSYYLEHDCTHREIARTLNISESRVLQLLRQCTKTMQSMVDTDERLAAF